MPQFWGAFCGEEAAESQFNRTVIPGELIEVERDPWFDRPFDKLTVLSKVEGLTTLSQVEGESNKLSEIQTILDPPQLSTGDDKMRHSFWR